MKLSNKQKQFLFDKGYVNANVLDAAGDFGWMQHYITKYDQDLAVKPDNFGRYRLE